jgi:hypothetical protein
MNFSLASLSQQINQDDFERGGYITIDGKTNNIIFVQTAIGTINQNGRKFVHLPNKTVRWHTHPYTDGFWPSFEDMNDLYKKGVSVIVTIRGLWIINGEASKNQLIINKEQLEMLWRPFHRMLTMTTQRNWKHAPNTIKKFISNIANKNGDVKFIHNGWITNGQPYNYISNCENLLRVFL